ncbi:ADP-ribosyl-[dinitrogen reductase] hydrolase [Variovorax sp. PDC80]|uniref:ADP-ribosylglycohydrolase family protein n=1 Tax=Variovorax sp. PDC80 TaxID=1882827 RepID=UPI0008E936C6|nr:ADP-ribosylglycohydrolase family protein [Variovorax sp. PDC80]SFP97794.1 ADP-ribosyl-[dinitrogen reductase] hydrolase [Variovorax sp. PDC80]
MAVSTEDRFRGALLGLACGDAVGTRVEFSPRGSFVPVTGMQGGGPFGLAPGEWTDDTSMALCLAASLIHCRGFDAVDQMNRYCNWRSVGYMSSNGRCFDIGITVSKALSRYLANGDPFAGDPDPRTAGNGALMRLAPVAMFAMFGVADTPALLRLAADSTRTTHGAAEAIACSRLFALQLQAALRGEDKASILAPRDLGEAPSPGAAALAAGRWRDKPRDAIKGSGYCVESLEAALWCFAQADSFEEAILAAANLGDDADTTAAICGQLAGAFHGVAGIPVPWLATLTMRDEIDAMARALFALAHPA